MRSLAMGLVLALCAAAPQLARADGVPSKKSSLIAARAADGDPLQRLLRSLAIDLIAKAQAAECKGEGEICKTNAECCSGLECSGEPQKTCRPEQ